MGQVLIFKFKKLFPAAIQIRSDASGLCHMIWTVCSAVRLTKKQTKHQHRMNAKRETISDSELSLCFTVLSYCCHSNYYLARLTADWHKHFLQIKPRCRTVTFEQFVNKSKCSNLKTNEAFSIGVLRPEMLLIVTSLCVMTFLLLLDQSRMVIFGLLGGLSCL